MIAALDTEFRGVANFRRVSLQNVLDLACGYWQHSYGYLFTMVVSGRDAIVLIV